MGLFDTVHFRCPSCGSSIEEQSKAGKCQLADYQADAVPASIAEGLQGEELYCSCGMHFQIELTTQQTFSLVLTPWSLSDE